MGSMLPYIPASWIRHGSGMHCPSSPLSLYLPWSIFSSTPLKWSSLDTGFVSEKVTTWKKWTTFYYFVTHSQFQSEYLPNHLFQWKRSINNQFPTQNPATNHQFHWKSMNIHWSIILMVSSSFKHIKTYLFPVKTPQGVPRRRSRSSWRCGWNNRSPGEKRCLDQWTFRIGTRDNGDEKFRNIKDWKKNDTRIKGHGTGI